MTEPISESKFTPTDDPFNITYNFKVLVFDSSTNKASQSKEAFDAGNLYEAYDKFLTILNDKNYDFMSPVESVQSKEYLLIGNFKPVVPSNLLKCIMQPPISGRDTCPEKLLNEITTNYKMLHDEYNFPSQAMIGFALDKGLIDFAKHYGDTEAFSDEINNIKGGAQNGRFYVVENQETNQYETAYYNDVETADAKFMKKVKEGSQGVLLKRHIGKKDVEDDEHNEVALEIARVSKSTWNENDRVSE